MSQTKIQLIKDGALAEDSIVHDGDTNTKIRFSGTDTITAETSGTERLRIDSSGNVGIGNISSPDGNLHVHDASAGSVTANTDANLLVLEDSASNGMTFLNPNTERAHIRFGTTGTNGNIEAGIQYAHENVSTTADRRCMIFKNAGFEAMRIHSSGALLIGTTGPHDDELLRVHEGGTNNEIANFRCSDANHAKNMINMIHMGSGDKVFFSFKRGGELTQVGRILTSSSSTTYQTSSDYRLKENVVALSNGISRLKTLKPYRFNFKNDPDKTVDGFFAHEVTAVPEAVSGTKDEVETTYYKNSDDIPEGKSVGDIKDTASPVYQGIDHSKLVPLLTAALQEEIAKREALETRVAALEAA